MACEVADGLRPALAKAQDELAAEVSMACEVADGLRQCEGTLRRCSCQPQFQWPVKWPMVCAHKG